MKIFILTVLLCFIATPLISGEFPRDRNKLKIGQEITTIASYYGKFFHGRNTANCEKFDMFAMTAASKTLPFNSVVEVFYSRKINDSIVTKSVVVRINDRGPYIAGRGIDLSKGAAKRLGLSLGKVRAVILKIGPKKWSCKKNRKLKP